MPQSFYFLGVMLRRIIGWWVGSLFSRFFSFFRLLRRSTGLSPFISSSGVTALLSLETGVVILFSGTATPFSSSLSSASLSPGATKYLICGIPIVRVACLSVDEVVASQAHWFVPVKLKENLNVVVILTYIYQIKIQCSIL